MHRSIWFDLFQSGFFFFRDKLKYSAKQNVSEKEGQNFLRTHRDGADVIRSRLILLASSCTRERRDGVQVEAERSR